MKLLLGTDIVDIPRVKKLCRTSSFTDRTFSQAERDMFEEKGKNIYQTIAGNFCAKEACVKALGTMIQGCSLIEIEVLRKKSGRPYIRFNGRLSPLNEKLSMQVSISHTDSLATATVIVWRKTQSDRSVKDE